MAITKKAERQSPIVASCDFTYSDMTDDTYVGMIDIPAGAIVTGGGVFVTTLFNSATDDKFSIGDKVGSATATKDTYAALSADITATGRAAALVPTGAKYSAASTVGVVWNGSGTAPSAGAGRLVVEYILDGRAQFTEG